jgi:hypothetical protein
LTTINLTRPSTGREFFEDARQTLGMVPRRTRPIDERSIEADIEVEETGTIEIVSALGWPRLPMVHIGIIGFFTMKPVTGRCPWTAATF